MPNSENFDLSSKLERLIETIDIANLLTSPIIESVRNLLEVSAAAIGSGDRIGCARGGSPRGLRVLRVLGTG